MSSMRHSVSSPDETLAEKRVENTTRSGVFLRNFEAFQGDGTLCRMLDITSQKMILEGEINDAKMSSFSSDFH